MGRGLRPPSLPSLRVLVLPLASSKFAHGARFRLEPLTTTPVQGCVVAMFDDAVDGAMAERTSQRLVGTQARV